MYWQHSLVIRLGYKEFVAKCSQPWFSNENEKLNKKTLNRPAGPRLNITILESQIMRRSKPPENEHQLMGSKAKVNKISKVGKTVKDGASKVSKPRGEICKVSLNSTTFNRTLEKRQ